MKETSNKVMSKTFESIDGSLITSTQYKNIVDFTYKIQFYLSKDGKVILTCGEICRLLGLSKSSALNHAWEAVERRLRIYFDIERAKNFSVSKHLLLIPHFDMKDWQIKRGFEPLLYRGKNVFPESLSDNDVASTRKLNVAHRRRSQISKRLNFLEKKFETLTSNKFINNDN